MVVEGREHVLLEGAVVVHREGVHPAGRHAVHRHRLVPGADGVGARVIHHCGAHEPSHVGVRDEQFGGAGAGRGGSLA